ncbi:MAG: hypothetical protein NZV14_01795 [Bryobacteraceae bacterium]|nr:hypothetical protein [Bryobacteraceae bacterium]MDW8376862.1 hypothetical protein [Bryobacterales bacterium]
MLFALALAVTFSDCVPARWPYRDPESLQLLDGSPINCLLVREATPAFRKQAAERQIRLLQELAADSVPDATMDGYVVSDPQARPKTSKPVIVLGERRAIQLEDPIAGTRQGVWPGIEISHGEDKSHPTGGAWIHTNTGVLRFLRSATKSVIWIANSPPAHREITGVNYLQAIADAAAVGARWVVSWDEKFLARWRQRDAGTLADWDRMQQHLRFYEEHKEWRDWPTWSQLALLQDVDSGALVSGNLMDMLAVMNTPVRAIPSRSLKADVLRDAKVAIVLNPQAYTQEQQELIARFAQSGGRVVSGPKGWKMPLPEEGRFTFDREHYKAIEAIWPELHSAVNRRNFAARLFNVSGALSYLQFRPDGKQAVLHLVNYTDYPVESITAFVQGKYRRATLYAPGRAPAKLSTYETPEGTGVEIDNIETCAAVLLE